MSEVVPNLKPNIEWIKGVFNGGPVQNLRVESPPKQPLSVPQNLSWQSLPAGWEALRYAQAAIPRPATLQPPNLHLIKDNNLYGAAGLTGIDDIGLTGAAMNAAAFPYELPEDMPANMARLTSTLPHELAHYLTLHAAKRQNIDPETYAREVFNSMPNYEPMYGHRSSNNDANFEERLANRVAMPYVDAQVVGQKAAPILKKANENPFKSGISSTKKTAPRA